MRANNHSACRSCKAPVTWVITAAGKKMPIDGHLLDSAFEPGAHVSHWSTCPDAAKFRRPKVDDGGGPGKRTPKDQIKERPPKLNFGEPTEAVKTKLALPRVPAPLGIQILVKQATNLARHLANRGYTREKLQALSKEYAGLSNSEHLHCCGDVPLKRLIKKLEELTNA